MTILLGASLLSTNCAPTAQLTCTGGSGGNWIYDDFQLKNARFQFKIENFPAVLPAKVFWFSGNDSAVSRTVKYGWDQALLNMHAANAPNCNFSAPGPGCNQCDFCVALPNNCTDGIGFGLVQPGLSTATLFKIGESGEQNVNQISDPLGGCLLRPGNPTLPSITADEDSNFELRKTFACGVPTKLAGLQTRVIHSTTRLTEPMDPYTGDADPQLRYRFSFKPEEFKGQLLENFSPIVKISKVRVLLAKKDPATGLLTINPSPDPAEIARMRPSRILFLSQFLPGDINHSGDEGTNRCYSDDLQPDGSFLMNRCLDSARSTSRMFNLTPNYQVSSPALDTFIWFIEYKTADGLATVPQFNANEVPILEFTLEP